MSPQRVGWLHQKLHANRGLWWCLRVQGRTGTEMFHGAVKSVCQPNRGLEREGISSGISRKPFLDLSILFYPFIYSLTLSFSLNPFRFVFYPPPQSFVTFIIHSLPPLPWPFAFISVRPSVKTIQTMLILAVPVVCNQMLNCTVRTSVWRLNQLYRKDFSVMS